MPRISAATVAEHRQRTYEALLDAVDALVLERGFAAVSLRDIAARAGVARTAVYNYAPDKTALLVAAAQRAAAQMGTAVAAVSADQALTADVRLQEVARLLLVTFAHDAHKLLLVRELHATLSEQEQERALTPFRDDVQRHLVRVVRDGTASGAFDPDLDVELTVDLVTGVLDAAVTRAVATPTAAPAIASSTEVFLRRALSPAPAVEPPATRAGG